MSNGLSEFSSELSHAAVFAKTQPSKRDNNFIITLPFKHKTQPKCSNPFLCCVLLTVHSQTGNLLHILNIYLVSSLHLPEGQAGTERNLQNSQRFSSLLVTINVAPLTSAPLLLLLLLLLLLFPYSISGSIPGHSYILTYLLHGAESFLRV
jgi:hypothetical protein